MRLPTRILFSLRITAARTARPRGSGAGCRGPASDRAGVWGGAPRETVMRLPTRILFSLRITAARTARPRGSGAGCRGPASDRAGVWGGAPREDRYAAPYENSVLVAA